MIFIYLFQCKMFEMYWLIGMKFCTVISTRMNFIMLVQNFEGSPQNSFRGQKHPKFGTILDNFKV